MIKSKFITGLFIIAMIAPSVTACLTPSLYDFGNAEDYGIARHESGEWQTLGASWDAETGPYDTSVCDGVTWSVDGGAYGHEAITAGSEVVFRFDFHRAAYGRHEYDQISAWLDTNNDNVWDQSEEILMVTWDKGDTKYNDNAWFAYFAAHGQAPNPDAVLQQYFYSDSLTLGDYDFDQVCLRARVSCSESIEKVGGMTPYNALFQGEVEDYAITVVPEPATMFILGLGSILLRRRK